MQEKYSFTHPLVGTVHIDPVTGALNWDQENLDPVVKLLGCSIPRLTKRPLPYWKA
jgi:hypothetical protein